MAQTDIDAEMSGYSQRRYELMLEQISSRPYWQWVCIDDFAACGLCRKRHGHVFHHSDRIWGFLPPIHKGCRCRFRALTPKQLEEKGLAVSSGEDFMERSGRPR